MKDCIRNGIVTLKLDLRYVNCKNVIWNELIKVVHSSKLRYYVCSTLGTRCQKLITLIVTKLDMYHEFRLDSGFCQKWIQSRHKPVILTGSLQWE
jgi:hypothetical protein